MSIFKQRYTKVDPKTGKRKTRTSKRYYVEYRDGDGVLRRVRGFADKESTKQLEAKLQRDAARQQAGLSDRFEAHRGRPLSEHVDDFEKHLKARDNTEGYVKMKISRVRRVIEGCGFRCVGDLSGSRVQQWLADHRGPKKMSARTSNFYLTTIKSFSRWLWQDRRIAEDPLAHLSGVNVNTDKRHERRALTNEEFGKLIAATRKGEPFRGLSGADRALLYLTAANTGLRRNELVSLSPSSFDFEATPATVTVDASYSKHRRTDVLPLRKDLASMLNEWLRGRRKSERCWPGTWWERAAIMLRKDLKAAGIPYKDVAGRYVDFHALRHFFCTNLARSGVHPNVAKTLARHSTIELTMDRYGHVELEEMSAALGRLPELAGDQKPKVEAPELTGQLTGADALSGHRESSRDPKGHADSAKGNRRKSGQGADVDTSCHQQTVVRPKGFEPLTSGLGNRCSILLSYGRLRAGQSTRRGGRVPASAGFGGPAAAQDLVNSALRRSSLPRARVTGAAWRARWRSLPRPGGSGRGRSLGGGGRSRRRVGGPAPTPSTPMRGRRARGLGLLRRGARGRRIDRLPSWSLVLLGSLGRSF